jgi:SAM-dependent methyltransferase
MGLAERVTGRANSCIGRRNVSSSADRFLIYPIPQRPLSQLERWMVRLRFGGLIRCTVCGALSLVAVKGANLRDLTFCVLCRSIGRQRQIAHVVCAALGKALNRPIRSLRDLRSLGGLVVYSAEARGALHRALRYMPGYVCSEYFGPDRPSGELVDGVVHQDLMALSFGDESVDLVITSDVFEHIAQPYRAHAEVYRVLRKGGRHVFTVPFHQTHFLDEVRATVDADGRTVHRAEPVYHGDPLRTEGALVYTIFSIEMLVKLARIGFRTNLYGLHLPSAGIRGGNAIVFEAIKE